MSTTVEKTEDFSREHRDESRALSQRLRESAEIAELSSRQIAGALGVHPSTVRAWWTGRNRPRRKLLRPYAALVGRSLSYFDGPGAADGEEQELQEARLLSLLAEGEPLSGALREVTGNGRVSGAADERHWDERRQLLYEILMQESHGLWPYFGEAGRIRFILDLIQDLPAAGAQRDGN